MHWKKSNENISKIIKKNYLDDLVKKPKSTPGFRDQVPSRNLSSLRITPLGKFE